MSSERVYQLGLFVRRTATGMEADLSLESANLVNPMTKMTIEQASFMVVGDRLMAIDPPEFVGLPPVALADFDTPGQLRNWVVADFKRMVMELERRSAELRQLGISPRVNAETLHLTALVEDGDARFEISSDKRGNFRLARAEKDGQDLQVPGTQTFELSDFRDLAALQRQLHSLVGLAPGAEPQQVPADVLSLDEAHRAFGPWALLPPRASLELLVELRARGKVYRFAAARVQGRIFRGLLAGPEGKVWSDRFDLGRFPGVAKLAAQVLEIPEAELELLGSREA